MRSSRIGSGRGGLRWSLSALAVAALLGALLWGLGRSSGPAGGAPAAGGPAEGLPNVILVSIDSLRDRNLGCYGYARDTSPFIDSLAARGVRFANAVSTTSWTLPAHAALFTGLYDSTHGLVDNGLRLGDGHLTLAELLRERGYHTAGFFGGPYLHPTFGLAQGFDVYRSCMTTTPDDASEQLVRLRAGPKSGQSHADVTGPRTLEQVTRWADSEARAPYFLFLHLWDVHYDYIPPAEYVEMFDPGYTGDLTGEKFSTNTRVKAGMPRRDLEHLIALYDAEIRFSDDILRRIFAALEQRGLLEDALIVITADHGEEFLEHDGKGHQRTLYDEVLRVPLIVSWAGRLPQGHVVEQQVRLIDVMPTLAHYAGRHEPLTVQGRNLAPLLEGGQLREEPALAELLVNRNSLRALRIGDFKVLQQREGEPAELLDLRRDPGERAPIVVGSPREAERLAWERRLLEATSHARRMKSLLRDAGPRPAEPRQDLLERLESLGYIGGD